VCGGPVDDSVLFVLCVCGDVCDAPSDDSALCVDDSVLFVLCVCGDVCDAPSDDSALCVLHDCDGASDDGVLFLLHCFVTDEF